MKSQSVAIIGGGFAGLGAAYRLAQAGFYNFQLYEAGDRLGGRARTLDLGDGKWIELGAQYFHSLDSEVYAIAKKCNALIPEGEMKKWAECRTAVIMFDGARLDHSLSESFWDECYDVTAHQMAASDDFDKSLTSAAAALTSLFAAWKAKHSAQLAQFTDKQVNSLLSLLERMAQLDYPIEDWNRLPTAVFALSEDDLIYEPIGGGGYSRIVKFIASQLPTDAVNLNRHVTKIDWGAEDGVRLTIEGAKTTERRRFDQVIVTCSIGVLKHHLTTLFTPALPWQKRAAIHHFGYGKVEKVIAEFRMPFWASEDPTVSFTIAEPPIARDFGPLLFGCVRVLQSHPTALMFWVSGEQVQRMYGMSDEQLVTSVMHTLKVAFPHVGEDDRRPTAITRTAWGQDAHFRGSYSRPKQTDARLIADTARTLAEPLTAADAGQQQRSDVVRLLFAGEATMVDCRATVHGAWRSGVREADRLLTANAAPPPTTAKL